METYTTPEYFHCLTDPLFRENVYEPEADTFLFLEALDQQKSYLAGLLRHRKQGAYRVVEVGCGSGVVITHLFSILESLCVSEAVGFTEPSAVVWSDGEGQGEQQVSVGGGRFYAVDSNPLALQATARTWDRTLKKYFWDNIALALRQHQAQQAASGLPEAIFAPDAVQLYTHPTHSNDGVVQQLGSARAAAEGPGPLGRYTLWLNDGDLLEALPGAGTLGTYDVVLFNPPYVPTSVLELERAVRGTELLPRAWCGGERGRVVLDRFLEMLPRYLSRHGCCFIVLIRENDVTDVYRKIQSEFRRHLDSLASRAEPNEAMTNPQRNGPMSEEEPMQVVCCAERYTGEHLSIHRISYKQTF